MKLPPIEYHALEDLKRLVKELESLDPQATSIDEYKQILRMLMKGHISQGVDFDPGLELFRARKFRSSSPPDKLGEIGAPPPSLVSADGRCNRAGESIFYCSSADNAPYFEVDAEPGDFLVLSKWRTTKRLLVHPVGYSQNIFHALGSTREAPVWGEATTELPQDYQVAKEVVDDLLCQNFCRTISDSEAYLYKVTIAVKEQLIPVSTEVGAVVFGGLMYPTIPMAGNCENLAVTMAFASTGLEFEGAEFVKVRYRADPLINVEYLLRADRLLANDQLDWKPFTAFGEPVQMSKVNFGVQDSWTGLLPSGSMFHWKSSK